MNAKNIQENRSDRKRPRIHRTWRPQALHLKLLEVARDEILPEYKANGWKMSVRALYYQLVSRGMLEGNFANYCKVTNLGRRGRGSGELDWDLFEDNSRELNGGDPHAGWYNTKDYLDAELDYLAEGFRLDAWEGQKFQPIVLVEKDGWTEIVSQACEPSRVAYASHHGDASWTMLRELVLNRFVGYLQKGRKPVILHLSDHDPSGINMSNVLDDHLGEFLDEHTDFGRDDFLLRRIGLTMDQIRTFDRDKLPPCPLKPGASLGAEYKRMYGDEAWELDALHPNFVIDLIRTEIDELIDHDVWGQQQDREQDCQKELEKVVTKFRKVLR